jgi:hypothetical protein
MQPVLHPFAIMREKMRKSGFASLTNLQQWEWHADVYAFRRVVLGVPPDVRVSPPDPEGQWFREDLVERAGTYYREKFVAARERKRKTRSYDLQREGRDIVTKWVQTMGFVSVDDYCERHGNDELAAHKDYLKSPEFKAASERQRTTGCG